MSVLGEQIPTQSLFMATLLIFSNYLVILAASNSECVDHKLVSILLLYTLIEIIGKGNALGET